LNKEEVEEVRFISLKISKEISENPENFTEWFKIILEEYKHHF
jgi:isopentenyl-diphosphate delta-isomerase